MSVITPARRHKPGVQEDREHPAHHKVPPQPVSGDAVLRDETSDGQRCVGREGSRDHRRAGQPPRHISAGQKELRRAAASRDV